MTPCKARNAVRRSSQSLLRSIWNPILISRVSDSVTSFTAACRSLANTCAAIKVKTHEDHPILRRQQTPFFVGGVQTLRSLGAEPGDLFRYPQPGRLTLAAIWYVFTLKYVFEKLGEDEDDAF